MTLQCKYKRVASINFKSDFYIFGPNPCLLCPYFGEGIKSMSINESIKIFLHNIQLYTKIHFICLGTSKSIQSR